MTKYLDDAKIRELAADFGVEDKDVVKVYNWMQENVEDYVSMTELAEDAMDEHQEIGELCDDADLFYELALLFVS